MPISRGQPQSWLLVFGTDTLKQVLSARHGGRTLLPSEIQSLNPLWGLIFGRSWTWGGFWASGRRWTWLGRRGE